MNVNPWARRGRFWAGMGCAAITSWLAFACVLVAAWWLVSEFAWGGWLALALVLFSFFGIHFCAALVCTFFWLPVATLNKCRDWGAWTVLLILAPTLLAGFLALLLLVLLFPFAIVPFHWGIECGQYWWTKRRWRQLLGLSNEWERDQEQ